MIRIEPSEQVEERAKVDVAQKAIKVLKPGTSDTFVMQEPGQCICGAGYAEYICAVCWPQ